MLKSGILLKKKNCLYKQNYYTHFKTKNTFFNIIGYTKVRIKICVFFRIQKPINIYSLIFY